MKLQIIIYCISTIFILSCNNKRTKYYPDGNIKFECNMSGEIVDGVCKGYYTDGTLKSESYWLKGKLDGVSKYYYPDGTIWKIVHWKSGKKNGEEILFYENGNVELEGEYLMDKPTGWFKEYSKDGKLVRKLEYFSIKDGKTVNQYITYDKKGDIIPEKSRYLIFRIISDTIEFGQEYYLKIKLVSPEYENIRLGLICGEEGFSHFHDHQEVKLIEGINSEVVYSFTPDKKGKYTICGSIQDYKIINETDTVYEEKANTVLFEKKFWVR